MEFRSVALWVSILFVLNALASGSSLSVSDALLVREVSPGDHIDHKVTVSIGKDQQELEAFAGIFGYGMGLDGARNPLEAEADSNPYSARGFLKISPESATLPPGEQVTFLIEGDVPDDVGSGGRYALAEIRTAPQGSTQVGISLAALVPILLTINGTDLVHTGEITYLSASSAEVSAIFENTGNHHFKANAEADLIDAEGEVVAKAEAPLMSNSLVPTASWLFKMAFEAEEELAPGTYIVEVSVIHEDGTVLDTEETTFEV